MSLVVGCGSLRGEGTVGPEARTAGHGSGWDFQRDSGIGGPGTLAAVSIALSLIIALTALIISGTSLWLSVLRPAKFSLTFLGEHTAISAGGQNGLPAITEIRGFVALANMGAQAGLLQRVDFGVPFVTPSEARRFAIEVLPSERGEPPVRLDGDPLDWPRTIEAGDVRTLELNFGFDGDLHRERLGSARTSRITKRSRKSCGTLSG